MMVVIASGAVDAVVFSTINVQKLLVLNGDLCCSSRMEMVLDLYQGGEDAVWCVRKRSACASGWHSVLACASYCA